MRVVVDAVRCWRAATDEGLPVQPSLFAMLAARGCEPLAPAFDSLLRLAEALLGRPITVGGADCSPDEVLLLDLFAARTRLSACAGRSPGLVRAFGGALGSTRAMLRMALDAPRLRAA